MSANFDRCCRVQGSGGSTVSIPAGQSGDRICVAGTHHRTAATGRDPGTESLTFSDTTNHGKRTL